MKAMTSFAFFLCLALPPVWGADLSPDTLGIRLGMSKEELLAARPGIHRKDFETGREVEFKGSDYMFIEQFPSTASFITTASYQVTSSTLVGIVLQAYAQKGKESELRRETLAAAKQLWGPSYETKIAPDIIRPGKPFVALEWDKGDHEVILMLPVNRPKGDHMMSAASVLIRTKTPKNKPLQEFKVDEQERKRILLANDILE